MHELYVVDLNIFNIRMGTNEICTYYVVVSLHHIGTNGTYNYYIVLSLIHIDRNK